VSTVVSFYVLTQAAADARLRCACRLAEEAVEQGARVYLQTATAADTRRLDDLLWTYSDGGFLPHEIYTGNPPDLDVVKVLLGEPPPPASHRDLLVNLTETLPTDLEQYARIAEIVDVDPERKRSARERYRQYRERGCGLESINV
jgi:DNA polymerase-3 subunit chi